MSCQQFNMNIRTLSFVYKKKNKTNFIQVKTDAKEDLSDYFSVHCQAINTYLENNFLACIIWSTTNVTMEGVFLFHQNFTATIP